MSSASADNIATFVEVVRQRSLSAAARRLELPKSTVSRRLLRLEEQLRITLLHRDSRSVTLTAEGRRFYESVFAAVDALDTAVSEAEHSHREPRGAIRVTAPPDLGRMVLAPMFVAFLERYADITLDLLLTNRVVDLTQEGIDIAIRAGRLLQPELIARKLCASHLQLAASPRLALQLTDVRALEQQPFVLHRASGRSQPGRLERSQGKRRQTVELTLTGRINVDDFAAMAELVAAGQGIGLMPRFHVQEGVQAGRLVQLLPEWSSPSSNIYLVYPARQQPERVRLLGAALAEAFAALGHV
jgi:DNA-binding transcriptional LysR family regulator